MSPARIASIEKCELCSNGWSTLKGGTICFHRRFEHMARKLNASEARQAVNVPPMKFVLSVSIVGAIFGVLVAWFLVSA